MNPFTVEVLEQRDHFSKSPPSAVLDPHYVFDDAALRKTAGANTQVFAAVPAPGDRTFLLAERYADPHAFIDGGEDGFLTIVAVMADGKLDPSFGTDGVALTARGTSHSNLEPPGILKLDDIGRIYFADGRRVLRFHADGSTDKSFGTGGAATFASADRPVLMCDIAPTDGGVLVATTRTLDGVQRFAVQKVGRRVRTVWQRAHDTGVASVNDDVPFLRLGGGTAQFAQSGGRIVLARVERDDEPYPSTDPESGDPTTDVGPMHQQVIATRFDARGHGTDLVGIEPQQAYDHASTYFGNAVLSPIGKTMLLRTDVEVLRFDFHARRARRFALPDDPTSVDLPEYRVQPDGSIYRFVNRYDEEDISSYNVTKYALDGTPDPAFAGSGVLTLHSSDFSGGFANLDQVFLGASGRVYLLATNGDSPSYVTLRRV